MNRNLLLILILSLLSGCNIFGCNAAGNGSGRITIRNDILDKEYNSFVVDQLTTSDGMTPFRATLRPEEQLTLPMARVTGMRFTRKYKDHSNIYKLKCDGSPKQDVTMRLIDVHTGRLSGTCELSRKGVVDAMGSTHWDE